jgi:hypothetical protein
VLPRAPGPAALLRRARALEALGLHELALSDVTARGVTHVRELLRGVCHPAGVPRRCRRAGRVHGPCLPKGAPAATPPCRRCRGTFGPTSTLGRPRGSKVGTVRLCIALVFFVMQLPSLPIYKELRALLALSVFAEIMKITTL